MAHDPFDDSLLPYDLDAFDPKAPQKPRSAARAAVLSAAAFVYDGRGLTLDQFQAYVNTYDFGTVPPDHVVFHHTANPDASWAPLSADPKTKWDRNEAGMSDSQIRVKRERQLDAIKNYYVSLDWNAGPHLFVDDRFIWIFTPMNTVGIHAKWGNSFRSFQKLHYSIGIEVIGYYGNRVWPPAVARLVGGAVRALQARLQTFQLRSMYLDPPSKPGMKIVNGQQVCAHPERLAFGGLASHRDYNKPECPGTAITEAFYLSVVQLDGVVDEFARWGPIGKPTGAATGFAVPRAWLVNKKLGACVIPETYSPSEKYSVTEFQAGIITYLKARNTTIVEMFT